MAEMKPCEHCGAVFQARTATSRFCSPRCVARWREANPQAAAKKRGGPRKYFPKPCEVCGMEFKPRSAVSRFCSHECALQNTNRGPKRVKTADRACEHCGAMYRPDRAEQRFCTRECSGKAAAPRMPVEERQCGVDGCERIRVRTNPGYCSKHYYRFLHYGDPLAEPTRQGLGGTVDLESDLDQVAETSHWKANPTHCPQGHEYSAENTYTFVTRSGKTRRRCRICSREQILRRERGETPNRTATCETCGVTWEASRFGTLPKSCAACGLKRHRNKTRILQGQKRGQVPKGATYICQACGMVSPTPPRTGMAPRFCDGCLASKQLDQKRTIWRIKNLRKYSITEERYFAIVEAQGNQCAVCGSTDPGSNTRRWHIDHDHTCCPDGASCGKCVRGLLCSRCNMAIGLLNDDISLLLAAGSYLENPPAFRIPEP